MFVYIAFDFIDTTEILTTDIRAYIFLLLFYEAFLIIFYTLLYVHKISKVLFLNKKSIATVIKFIENKNFFFCITVVIFQVFLIGRFLLNIPGCIVN